MKTYIPQCPTLRPSFKEFQHFSAYVQKVEKQYRNTYGMVKIVPPREWISRIKNYDKIINNLMITKPQYQSLYGDPRKFYFNCQNGNHRPLKIQQFKELAAKKAKEISDYKTKEDIQQYFWSKISSLRNQLYCANIEVTLMDSTSGEWEFQKLKSFFNQAVTEKLNGLNTSFLFIGAWRTFFNWHIEDLDLSAINLVHEGATKMWYCIHPQDRKRYEGILKDLYPEQNMNCPNFFRHKQIYLNPYKLKEKYPYLRISKMYQNPREISLAFANGYHCGFNMGYNIAEAVNYGTKDWLQRYGQFKKCKCPIQAGVSIEYQDIVNNLKKSALYTQIKNTNAFAKILEKAQEEIEVDQLYKKADSSQIREEVERERSKSCNKGKEYVFVRKYNRYFPVQDELIYQIKCDSCLAWRKIDEKTKKMYKTRSFDCTKINTKCRLKGDKKKSKVRTQKSKTKTKIETKAETRSNTKRKMIHK